MAPFRGLLKPPPLVVACDSFSVVIKDPAVALQNHFNIQARELIQILR